MFLLFFASTYSVGKMRYNVNILSFFLLISSCVNLDTVKGQQPQFQTHLDAAMAKWQNYDTDKYYYEFTTTLQSDDGTETIQVDTNFGIHTVQKRVLDVFIVPDATIPLPAPPGGQQQQDQEEHFTREEIPDSL